MGSAAATAQLVGDREMVVSRHFDAPRQLVWDAWTTPTHADQWWGPNGFSNTTHEHELRVGGVWRHTMHGPDGTDYPNRHVFREIDPPARLVYSHGWDRDDGELYEAQVDFEEVGGGTLVTLRSIFSNPALLTEVVEKFGALEGGQQHLENLAEYLANLRSV